MANFTIKYDLKGIHKDNIGKHLHDSLHAAIARVDAVLKQSFIPREGWRWRDTFHESSTFNYDINIASFTIDCSAAVADMILAELLQDSSYLLVRGPYEDGSSRLRGADFPRRYDA